MVTELLSSASNSSTLRRCSSSAAGVASSSSSSSSVSTQSSSSVFDSLCNELLVEILQRLPLKAVHRCKCVSKRWLITISSTGFVRCYVRYHNHGEGDLLQPLALFYQYRDSECGTITPDQMGVHLVTTTLPQHPNHHIHTLFNSTGFTLNFISPPKQQQQQEPIRILAVSNGLVLCSSTFIFPTQYFVCNPLTRHWLALPPPPTRKKFVRIGFICTTTTTSSSFRVVRVRDYGYPSSSSTPTGLELFSSERWKWTKISLAKVGQNQTGQRHKQAEQKQICQWLDCPRHSKAVVCCGILHWHSVWGAIFAYDPYKRSSCRVIGLPNNINTRAADYYLGECNGRLRYIQFDLLTFTLWELKDYRKKGPVEWCLLKQVSMDQMVSEDPWIVNYIKRSNHPFLQHLAFHPFDGDIFFLSFVGRIVQCNMRTRTLESVCHLDHADAYLFDSMVFPIVLPGWPTPLSSLRCKRNLL